MGWCAPAVSAPEARVVRWEAFENGRRLYLDCPSHSVGKRAGDLLHRRLAARTYRQESRAPLGAGRDRGGLGHADHGTSSGQVQASGAAVTTRQIVAAPFAVRVKHDDSKVAASLPAGTAGAAAI